MVFFKDILLLVQNRLDDFLDAVVFHLLAFASNLVVFVNGAFRAFLAFCNVEFLVAEFARRFFNAVSIEEKNVALV